MKILIITTHLDVGGIPNYVTTLTGGLIARGHEVIVASRGGPLVDRLTAFGARHIMLPLYTKNEISPRVFLSLCRLLGALGEERVDVVHAQTRITQMVARLYCHFTKTPYIVTAHGFFKRRIGRRLFALWGDRTIAISEEVGQHLVDVFQIAGERITVINNGIDVDFFSQAVSENDVRRFKSTYGISGGPVIGIISRLSQVKGHIYLIDAMAKLLKRRPEATLVIVGDGRSEYRRLLDTRATKLNIANKVIFIPGLLDIHIALAAIDIFVLPSTQEGLGLSLLEAMAAGLPVIASEVGGIKSIIKDTQNGLLIKPKSDEAIYAAIVELLDNKSLANKLSTMARETVRQTFDIDSMVRKTEEVYRRVLGEE
ncbi:MAG: glycosyltransferase family 4 protein [Candidatus Omnitrophica bacterium]|nr:glycosyltransferase family 4 protein [Candidatus Omnitrophota bacterium]